LPKTRAVRASPSSVAAGDARRTAERETLAIAALARHASVEMTWHDSAHLEACRRLLAPGTLIYVSHIPGQTWRQTLQSCLSVRAAGLEPVPHLPVRELEDQAALEQFVADLAAQAHVRRVLLIAGDRATPAGPFSEALDVLRCGVLTRHGIRQITVAGHPEGHPRVPNVELRRAEREKVAFAEDAGIELTFLTQFFFEAPPFIDWLRQLRVLGVRTRVVAGLAGPTKLRTLFRYALRCGIGPSLRALGTAPTSLAGLVGERGPESIVRAIARASGEADIEPVGIHLYSFGGLVRSCAWIDAVANRRFVLDGDSGFRVREQN
jgi:methylenetetrahydrofolate reductase (NADPH)